MKKFSQPQDWDRCVTVNQFIRALRKNHITKGRLRCVPFGNEVVTIIAAINKFGYKFYGDRHTWGCVKVACSEVVRRLERIDVNRE